jgi:hypothetical protein
LYASEVSLHLVLVAVILWLYSQNQFQEDADGLLPEYMRRMQIAIW